MILQRGIYIFKIYAHNITVYLVPIQCTRRHFYVFPFFFYKEAINQFPVKESYILVNLLNDVTPN